MMMLGLPERFQRLDGIGFVYDPLTADWKAGFAAQKFYQEREGHCRVPGGQKKVNNSLGQWVHV